MPFPSLKQKVCQSLAPYILAEVVLSIQHRFKFKWFVPIATALNRTNEVDRAL